MVASKAHPTSPPPSPYPPLYTTTNSLQTFDMYDLNKSCCRCTLHTMLIGKYTCDFAFQAIQDIVILVHTATWPTKFSVSK